MKLWTMMRRMLRVAVALTEDNVDDFEDSLNTDGITIDDPVKVYLKEIGRRASADAGGGD